MPNKIWGADLVVSNEVWVSSEKVRAIAPGQLGDWARATQLAVNETVDAFTVLEQRMEQSDRQLAELKKWVQGSATFLEFVTQRYPDVIRDFNTVENAKMRVADTKECFQIVEKE
jgi:hypothetical protein